MDIDDLFFSFRPARRIWKPLLKWLVTGTCRPMVMRPGPASSTGRPDRLGLYLHVPFCRNLCPFCPYHREAHDDDRFARYLVATHREIDAVADRLAEPKPRIVSLYVGGGTPTVHPEGLAGLLRHLQDRFGPPGDVCVELHPASMDDLCLDLLRQAGTTMLSVGVESLDDRHLQRIGRKHTGDVARDSVKRALGAGFQAVNVDLMFALPGQTLEDLDRDLQGVLAMGPDQLSTYPIFGFPYTELGTSLDLRGIRRPPSSLIRRMLDLITRRAEEAGLEQCAVWSFVRPGRPKFSSITRHHYLGFGPSAASMVGGEFRVNTFSLEEYDRTPGRAMVLPVSARLEMAYWLYWRVYELEIRKADFLDLFGADLDQVFGTFLGLLRLLGLAVRTPTGYRIPRRAAYWVHRLQNEYSLNYINRVWGLCRREAWPDAIRL